MYKKILGKVIVKNTFHTYEKTTKFDKMKILIIDQGFTILQKRIDLVQQN